MPFYQGFLCVVSCRPSQYEKENDAALIFSIMSKNIGVAIRVIISDNF